MEFKKELLKRGHSDPAKGAKRVRTMITTFETRISKDIDRFVDPAFADKNKNKNKDEDEEEED